MMEDKRIAYSAVIPLFNEARNVTELYGRLKAVMDRLEGPYEIIVVDDGSTDGSFDILKKIALSDKVVKVLRFDRNYGQHKAITAGVLEAYGEYVVTLDADLQNPPEEIEKLINKSREGYDMVAGYRKVRKDTFTRRLCSYLTNLVISSINGLRMRDYGTMLRVFKRDTARALVLKYLESEGYITMFIAKITRNVAEIEVRHDERYSGSSKYSIRNLIPLFYKIIFYYHDGLRNLVARKEHKIPYIIERKIADGKEVVFPAKDR